MDTVPLIKEHVFLSLIYIITICWKGKQKGCICVYNKIERLINPA